MLCETKFSKKSGWVRKIGFYFILNFVYKTRPKGPVTSIYIFSETLSSKIGPAKIWHSQILAGPILAAGPVLGFSPTLVVMMSSKWTHNDFDVMSLKFRLITSKIEWGPRLSKNGGSVF